MKRFFRQYGRLTLALAAVLAFCAVLPLLFQQSRSIETGSWGLSFRTEGQPPAGNASKEALRRYDAVYLGDETQKKLYLTFDAGYENGCTEPILEALAKHKPKWALMAHWETGSGRVNDVQGFSDACQCHGVLGLVDAVSSLGIADFSIDDYPGVHGWASCPQKGVLCLPMTYAPVSFTDRYIAEVRANGAATYVHHPVLEARHWGVIDGKDVAQPAYHRTHSGYAVAAFHEALRLTLEHGRAQKARDYAFHESALRWAVEEMGCTVTSNMTSLVVLNLPSALAGREKELVQKCRADGFGIWPTLSEPVQVRIGILNQLGEAQITEIVSRFADALIALGGVVDKGAVMDGLARRYRTALAAE